MYVTKKSEIEIILEGLLKESERIIDDSYLTAKEARKIVDYGYKILYNCERLRKSRDKWKNKSSESKREKI